MQKNVTACLDWIEKSDIVFKVALDRIQTNNTQKRTMSTIRIAENSGIYREKYLKYLIISQFL